MPRYHFNVHDGRDIPDEDGVELPDDDAARKMAIVAAGESLRDGGWEFWSGEEWTMHVTDDAGETVCQLRFSAVVPRARQPADAHQPKFSS